MVFQRLWPRDSELNPKLSAGLGWLSVSGGEESNRLEPETCTRNSKVAKVGFLPSFLMKPSSCLYLLTELD